LPAVLGDVMTAKHDFAKPREIVAGSHRHEAASKRLTMTEDDALEWGAFVLRCMAATVIAFFLSSALGLPRPLWACVFALIVSQESVAASVSAIGGRGLGTVIGAVVTILVDGFLSQFGLEIIWRIIPTVAVCALF